MNAPPCPKCPFLRFLPCGILILLATGGQAAGQTPQPFVRDALAELELQIGGGLEATVSSASGLVTFLSFAPHQRPLVRSLATAPAEDRALDFLGRYGAAFGIRGVDQLAVVRTSDVDSVGMEHVRLRQTYRGVPVTGGELVVHLRGSEVVAVNAKTIADLSHVATTPLVGPQAAAEAVWRVLDRRLGVTEAKLSEPRLELFNRGLLESRRGWTRLAWFVEASAIALREYFWVDAESGAALLHFSQLTDARDREIYDADDPGDGVYGTLPGVLVRSEGEAPTGDADADAAYDYSGDTYDYFMGTHARDSYDGAGATLISTVHFCPDAGSCPYVNAFWNGTQMVYGEGFPAADDVDAHELTHAVTEHSANLFYYMQSGALNESLSDIFGETVDLINASGSDTPADRWYMGEDVPGIGAIRHMMNPNLFGDPGRVGDPAFFCGDDYRDDRGGVHINSGVPNHFYALLVDGGTFNSETVAGIGLTKAGKIVYRAQASYLTSASDFLDFYDVARQSCDDLVGTSGITAADCTEVEDALDAVEMSMAWPCSPPQGVVASACPAGTAPDLWHHTDWETSGFSACPPATVPGSWCLNTPTSLLGAYATSGDQSVWGYNRAVAGYMWLSVAPAGTLPADSRMLFNHSHGFENDLSFYDGGVVEYSTDSGTIWLDGGSLIVDGQAYGGTVSSCCTNPLGGRSAFVADSWGYTNTLLDLSSLGGGTFSYRFYLGTDFSVDEYGWWVDDIWIYSCHSCLTNWILDAAYNGLASEYQAEASLEAGSGFVVGGFESVTLSAPEVRLSNTTSVYGELAVDNTACMP